MLVWAAHIDTFPRFHQLLALVTCFPPDASSRLSLSRLDSLHLPEKMHQLCSRNACSPFFFGLAFHQIPQPFSFCSTFRLSSFSPALSLSHSITLLPCSGPQKKLDGRPALSKKGAAVIADSPTIALASLMDMSTLRILHVADL